MLYELLRELIDQWRGIWSVFEGASAVANAIQIGSGVGTVVLGVRWYVHRRLRNKDGVIIDLKDDLADRSRKRDELRERFSALQNSYDMLMVRLPGTALERMETEAGLRNYQRRPRPTRVDHSRG